MERPIRVFLVDDHQMFREGVRHRLEQEPDMVVVGEAASAQEALAKLPGAAPAILLVDIRLPDASGIQLARQLRDQGPEPKIVILSGYDFDQYVRALARIGVEGYLLKEAPQESLVAAIREVAGGGVVLPPRIASKVIRSFASSTERREDRKVWDLTLREIEIVEVLHQGMRNAEIAKQLGISPRTVETHVSNIIAKLGAKTRAEAVRIAEERHLIR